MISQGGDGNFRFSSIFHRNLSISLKFPPKNYGEILIFFAVKAHTNLFYCCTGKYKALDLYAQTSQALSVLFRPRALYFPVQHKTG